MYVCMYINNIFIVYDNGWDWVVYLKLILFLKTKRNDLSRPVMGTIFLVYIAILD